jgi:hypothetical protein
MHSEGFHNEECDQNRKGKNHLGDLCLARRIILKRTLKISGVDSYAS